MNSFNSCDQELFDQTGTWNDDTDPTLDLLLDQPLTQHLHGCPTQYQDVGECLLCNFSLPSGGQDQMTLPQGPQQYSPRSHSALSSATETLTWTQANPSRLQQYPSTPFAQPGRSSWIQQAPSSRSSVAMGTSMRQSQVSFDADMQYNYSASQYHPTSTSLPVSRQAQQYHNSPSAARQANVTSFGQIIRQIPSGEGFVRPVAQQLRPEYHRLSPQTLAASNFHSQLSSGLALPTDYQAPSINSVSHNVASWMTQPRVPGERSTVPTTPQQLLQPIPQSSPISENSSSGTRSRRGAAEMRQLDGDNQYQCTYPGCHKTYPKAGELSKHEKRCHGDPAGRPHGCPVHGCPRRFNYPREVRRHVASKHVEMNEYFCPYIDCQFAWTGFARSDHLERHVRTKHRRGSAQGSVSMSRTSSSQTY